MPEPAQTRDRVRLTARALALSERLARRAGRTTGEFVGRTPWLAPDDLPIGRRVGPYVLEQIIGRGGMSVVYRARDEDGAKLALKIARFEDLHDPQCRDRMLLEALVLDGLDHPAIAALHDIGELPDGRPWLALELVKGEPLNQRLARGRLTIDEACAVVAEIADALAAAHAAGVIHRDLKPDNVIMVQGGSPRCKVVDWGVARSRALPHARITEIGVVSGTPLYMSPEQARGRDVDGRSDIYALGVMLYEMLTGEVPFDAEDSVSILMLHVGTPAPRPTLRAPELPRWLDQLVLAMLAKQPSARPPLADIKRLLAGRGRVLGEVLAELEAELVDAGVGTIDAA